MVLRLMLLSLLAISASAAETNYVYVSGSRPLAHAKTCEYDVEKDTVVLGASKFGGIDWSTIRIVSTISPIPSVFTNISQVTVLEVVLPITTDEKRNWERLADAKLRAIITGLVKTINLRLPSAQKITAAELKTAIKEELP